MSLRALVLLMATSLISVPLATALPTEKAPTGVCAAPRDETQCSANTQFYVCSVNDFRGCCSVDPCALKDGCPDKAKPGDNNNNDSGKEGEKEKEPPKPAPSCPSPGKKTKLFQPQMQTLHGESAPISTPNFNVSKTESTEWQQLMTWKLPGNAKSCALGWSIAKERNFQAGKDSLVNVYDAAGKDNKDSKENKKALGNANFAFWPETPGARANLVSTVKCKEDLSFRLQLVHKDQVFIEQNEVNGWWVEYEC